MTTLTFFDIDLPQVYHDHRMKLKVIAILVVAGLCFFNSSDVIIAKKKLPTRTVTTKEIHPYGVWVKPRLRSDRHALLLMLGGMSDADKIEYSLIYNAGPIPIPQGIKSYHTPEDGNIQKELVFGSCSGNDCIYHGDITDMKLEVIINLKDDRTLIYRYQINP